MNFNQANSEMLRMEGVLSELDQDLCFIDRKTNESVWGSRLTSPSKLGPKWAKNPSVSKVSSTGLCWLLYWKLRYLGFGVFVLLLIALLHGMVSLSKRVYFVTYRRRLHKLGVSKVTQVDFLPREVVSYCKETQTPLATHQSEGELCLLFTFHIIFGEIARESYPSY